VEETRTLARLTAFFVSGVQLNAAKLASGYQPPLLPNVITQGLQKITTAQWCWRWWQSDDAEVVTKYKTHRVMSPDIHCQDKHGTPYSRPSALAS